MNHREVVTLAGRQTGLALEELSDSDRIRHSPATHVGACVFIPGVKDGMTFTYDNMTFKIVRSFDESEEALKKAGSKNRKKILSDAEMKYHTSRVGKFVDLLVKVEGS